MPLQVLESVRDEAAMANDALRSLRENVIKLLGKVAPVSFFSVYIVAVLKNGSPKALDTAAN